MKRLVAVTSLLSVVAVWCATVPLGFLLYAFPPEKTLTSFARFGARLPFGAEFLVRNVTAGRLCVLALLFSGGILWFGVGALRDAKRFAHQTILLACGCSAMILLLLWFCLPCFRMGEVVAGFEHKGPKHALTQIQFVTDSLRPMMERRLFMQREGDTEVALPWAEGEWWSDVEVAQGTNKVFVFVRADLPKPTNDAIWRAWPSRAMEITLPSTNEPLTNYTLRTVFACKPKEDVVSGELVPSGIASTWDGAYLTVHYTIHEPGTNAHRWEPMTGLYDVQQAKWLSTPPTMYLE